MSQSNRARRHFLSHCLVGATAIGSRRMTYAVASEYRSLFDGQTLAGWHTEPRLPIALNDRRFDSVPPEKLREAVRGSYAANPQLAARLRNRGEWKVEDGAIVGGQLPGTQAGAYLISDETFGDFELTLEARPDFPIDTGIMVRAHELGSIGFQVLVDHRKDGAIGGIFGNSIGNFRAYPFVVDGDEEPGFRVANIRPGTADGPHWKPDYAASFEDFRKAWRPNEWNTFRIRCTGEMPLIETWINNMPIAKLDTTKLSERVVGFDPEAVLDRIGRRGHIAFEVHDNGKSGRNRWAPGAVCRWKNIRILDL